MEKAEPNRQAEPAANAVESPMVNPEHLGLEVAEKEVAPAAAVAAVVGMAAAADKLLPVEGAAVMWLIPEIQTHLPPQVYELEMDW
jgi:hypothetical protein